MLTFKNYLKKFSDSFNHEKQIHKDTHKEYKNVHGNTVHHGVSKKTGGKITIIHFGE